MSERVERTTVRNSYGNTVYRCTCGYEAWGASVNYHEMLGHGGMQPIGAHRWDRATSKWIFKPLTVK